MIGVMDLWLAILLSAVAVFMVSSVVHMCLPIHKSDHGQLPQEAELLADMRARGVGPGSYVFPYATSMKDMESPEMKEKLQQGPVGFLTVMPGGGWNMGQSLVQWFLFSLLISFVVGYLASACLDAGTATKDVFRITSTVALLGYGVSNFTDSIWKGVRWSVSFKFLFDGLLYGLATGGVFAWLWPAA